MSIYQNIQRVAKNKKLSIREVEQHFGFSNGTMRKWQNSAPADKLSRVANYLGVTSDYLILGHVNGESMSEGVSSPKKNEASSLVAAHIDDDTSEEEREQIINFIEYLKNQRKNK